MRVNVAAPLDQYTVDAKASATAVPVGTPYSIIGTVNPVPEAGFARTVHLQQKVDGTWKTIESQQTSSRGRFDFDVTGDKAGVHSYRC